MDNDIHAPGVYEKHGQVRVADTRRDAVALVFDGYIRKVDEDPDANVKIHVTPGYTGTDEDGNVIDDVPNQDETDENAPTPERKTRARNNSQESK